MANTYNPTLAKNVAQATGSRFQDVGKDFNEGFKPGMEKAVNYLEKQEAEAEAQRKKDAAAEAKKIKEKEELALNDYKNAPDFEVDEKSGISNRMLGKVVNFGKQYKKEYSDTVTGFKNNMNASFEERLGYEDQKKNIGTNFQQLIKDAREVSEALLEIDQSLKEGAMSTANGPEEAKVFKNLYETLEPTAQPGVFTWSNPETGKTEEITKSQIAEETDKFIFVGAKSYEAILSEADAIAAGTKTTVKGKQYYNFNEPQKRTLRAKLNAQLADPDTGDDFLFDTISNNKTPVGPLNMGERYNGKSKSVILAQAKLDMGNNQATDDEAKEFLRNQVAETYIDLFSKAFPTPPNEVEKPKTDVEKPAVSQAKTFLDKAKNDNRWEGITNPSATLFKTMATPEFESKITDYGLTATPIIQNEEQIGWRVYNPASGFKGYAQDLMFEETLPAIDKKIDVAIGSNHPDVFELPVISNN